MIGKKDGLATREEIKILVDISVDATPLKGIAKSAIKMVLPIMLDSLDNNVGEKLPEKWQLHAEGLITLTVDALKDKVITKEEEDEIVAKCSEILNAEIDVPMVEENDEAVAFLFVLKFIATQIRKFIAERKAKKSQE